MLNLNIIMFFFKTHPRSLPKYVNDVASSTAASRIFTRYILLPKSKA